MFCNSGIIKSSIRFGNTFYWLTWSRSYKNTHEKIILVRFTIDRISESWKIHWEIDQVWMGWIELLETPLAKAAWGSLTFQSSSKFEIAKVKMFNWVLQNKGWTRSADITSMFEQEIELTKYMEGVSVKTLFIFELENFLIVHRAFHKLFLKWLCLEVRYPHSSG